MRLLTGILAGQPFTTTLTGEAQLLRRPMSHVVEPLLRMGAQIQRIDHPTSLSIQGGHLRARNYALPIASAQLKSALLLAGLYALGRTTIHQPGPARDHTERMLSVMGARLRITSLTIELTPTPMLTPFLIQIPGDLSSAAFPLVAAALVPNSAVTITDVGVNPTRTGLLDMLIAMGAEVMVDNQRQQGNEPVADLTVQSSTLQNIEIGGEMVVRMIDEFPLLAVAATQAHGITVVQDAAELRAKETDRISTITSELRKMGAQIHPMPDGFVVTGPTPLHGGVVDSHGDHRLAMALVVAGLIAHGETTVNNAHYIDDSFPGFVTLMQKMGARICPG